jgi:hypothetical protein
LFDHSDGLVADHQPRLYRILAADDVKVCAADGGERHPNDRLAWAGPWTRNLFYTELVHFMEHVGTHRFHCTLLT